MKLPADDTPELSPLALDLRDAFMKTYCQHHNALPKGFRDFDPNADFSSAASVLASGDPGYTVYGYGREFCLHLLPNVEEVGAYELLAPLKRAIEAGECAFDCLGHLEVGHAETTTVMSLLRGMPLGDADLLV